MDYLNDTEGYYVGFCGQEGGPYHVARYSDIRTAADNLGHVISNTGLRYFMFMEEETLLVMTQALESLATLESSELEEKPIWFYENSVLGNFMLTKGFPKGDPGTSVHVVQDHSDCTEDHCLELDPNFEYTYS